MKIVRRSVSPPKKVYVDYLTTLIYQYSGRRPRPIPTTDEFVMCYPGTLNWHQGLDLAIEAMSLLRATEFQILRNSSSGTDRSVRKLRAMISDL